MVYERVINVTVQCRKNDLHVIAIVRVDKLRDFLVNDLIKILKGLLGNKMLTIREACKLR